MRVRTSWFRRLALRTLFLGPILRTGRFPTGARAVREIQPHGGPFDQDTTARRLDEETRAFERELDEKPRVRLTHPLFGTSDAATSLRFLTVHLLHHRGQILRRDTTAG